MALDKWLADKERRRKTEAAEAAEAVKASAAVAKPAPPEKKGWFGRLLDKAHQPLK